MIANINNDTKQRRYFKTNRVEGSPYVYIIYITMHV